jgi:hypothetical protein
MYLLPFSLASFRIGSWRSREKAGTRKEKPTEPQQQHITMGIRKFNGKFIIRVAMAAFAQLLLSSSISNEENICPKPEY